MAKERVFDTIAEHFKKHGLTVTPTPGASRSDKCKVTIMTDGVPYCLDPHDMYGEFDPEDIEHDVLHYRLTYERHHEKVKAVYDHCLSREGLGPVWAMCGGGMQLQVFFGNEASGYLAILYLDLEELEHQARMGDYMAAVGNATFTLVVNGKANNKHFRQFKHPQINVRFDT